MTRNIIAKELGGDLMLYDAARDEVHILNGTARLIYELHEKGKDIAQIAELIKSSFRVEDTGRIEQDIRRSIDELKRKGLIAANE